MYIKDLKIDFYASRVEVCYVVMFDQVCDGIFIWNTCENKRRL